MNLPIIDMQIPLVIDIQNATIANDDRIVLEDINFSLAQGEMTYIIGKSGSGKSSLMKTLYAANAPQSGSVRVGDFHIERMKRKEIPLLRRSMGMVFQDFNLFKNWTVRQNLEYVLKATDWKIKQDISNRVIEVLTQVGLVEKIDQHVHTLSGGEQQRIVIARAILNHPKLILADEPTGNLDPDTSKEIFHLLYAVANKNKSAMLITTHDYRIIDLFPAKVYECTNNNVVEFK